MSPFGGRKEGSFSLWPQHFFISKGSYIEGLLRDTFERILNIRGKGSKAPRVLPTDLG